MIIFWSGGVDNTYIVSKVIKSICEGKEWDILNEECGKNTIFNFMLLSRNSN